MSAIELVANDTSPNLQCTMDGVDLTGYSIELHVAYATPLIKTATLTEAAAGEFEFEWSAGDLVAGIWPAHIQVTTAALTVQTFTGLTLNIAAEIA